MNQFTIPENLSLSERNYNRQTLALLNFSFLSGIQVFGFKELFCGFLIRKMLF
jgi:hypothetical protein